MKMIFFIWKEYLGWCIKSGEQKHRKKREGWFKQQFQIAVEHQPVAELGVMSQQLHVALEYHRVASVMSHLGPYTHIRLRVPSFADSNLPPSSFYSCHKWATNQGTCLSRSSICIPLKAAWRRAITGVVTIASCPHTHPFSTVRSDQLHEVPLQTQLKALLIAVN